MEHHAAPVEGEARDPAVELVPASRLSLAELAALFTSSFHGYRVAMKIDEPTYSRMARLYDFDLDASRVAMRGGRTIGLVNLGVRGQAAWIGGMGVVPDERRRGVAGLLMRGVHDAARTLGVTDLRLEALDSNTAAIRLYEGLGYGHVRDLEVWSLEGRARHAVARDVPVAEARATVRELRIAPEPWQRNDATLDRMEATETPLRGLDVDGGAAIIRLAAHGVVVEQIAARDSDAARALLDGALGAGSPVRLTDVPAGDPVSHAFAALGGHLELRQHELRLEL